MKKLIIIFVLFILSSGIVYANYSNNPHCRGFGIVETEERKKCLAANANLLPENKKKLVGQGGIKNKAKGFFKGIGDLGINTDSKLFKTGKYSKDK